MKHALSKGCVFFWCMEEKGGFLPDTRSGEEDEMTRHRRPFRVIHGGAGSQPAATANMEGRGSSKDPEHKKGEIISGDSQPHIVAEVHDARWYCW